MEKAETLNNNSKALDDEIITNGFVSDDVVLSQIQIRGT